MVPYYIIVLMQESERKVPEMTTIQDIADRLGVTKGTVSKA